MRRWAVGVVGKVTPAGTRGSPTGARPKYRTGRVASRDRHRPHAPPSAPACTRCEAWTSRAVSSVECAAHPRSCLPVGQEVRSRRLLLRPG
eukprot:scaffold3267_cov112-Isochrysis_galbana.AAC.2